MHFPCDKKQLSTLLERCLIKDRHRLRRQLAAIDLKKVAQPAEHGGKENNEARADKTQQAWLKWCQAVEKSIEQVEANQKAVPENIEFDSALPVAAKREELVELIKQHQVVVIAGETGSGKTTQIPKMCLQAGQGVFGRIGCTQPRRLAARSVAERLAEELGSTLGDLVGYQVRFQDHVHSQSLIKVMTDGILLAEVQNDRFLNQYDTIIIDEAHERSINIDFLLGILKQLLPKRPDLKVIITSATIDTQRFADHFTENGIRPPVIEVSGRTYPVEVRYRPLVTYEDDAGNEIEQDLPTAIVDALDELSQEDPFGDVLVFQVGERDIKETAEALRKHQLKNTEIVPLYARLSLAEQNKVFQTSQKRRVILSTNVAETSLTVPGIKYVIDPGLVRISRYSVRSKVQRLPVEKISQASANQRKGRCGRVSEGICIRLYSEEDFNARPQFTDPEIHRTSLASIILTMAQLKLGEVKHFPFIEAPTDKSINDGFRQLHELGALDDKRRLTEEGRQLAKLPVDPSIAKMILQAQSNNVLAEVLVIAAVLSIQDPRDMNESTMQAARQAHKPFEDERSDFLFFLNLWHFYEHQRRHLSQNKLRKLCKTNFLSYMRMKEWHELYMQLEQSLKRSGIEVPPLHLFEEVKKGKEVKERLSDLHSINVHRSLLAGLLGNVAMRDDEKSYLGARNTKLFIHPSSVLFKQKPKWMLSAELVETSKLYARTNAAIDIRWVEPLAKHLIKRSYHDPHWQKKSGQVGAYESITLYGLPIVNQRRCNYGPINPKEARKIFIRHALVEGELNSRAKFFRHNQQLIGGIEKLESKLRRPDYLVDDEVLYRFYDERIPAHIYNQPALETWLNKLKPGEEKALYLTEEQLLKQAVDVDLNHDFPDQIQLQNQLPLKVDYRFEPGKKRDGVVFKVPLHTLNLLQPAAFEWLTPGFLKEKIVFYIKALPKQLRKQFVPAPAVAEQALQWMESQSPDHSADFEMLLVQALNRHAAQKISAEDFGGATGSVGLPDYLRPYFILLDDKRRKIAEGADLNELKAQYQHLVDQLVDQKLQQAKENAGAGTSEGIEKRRISEWDFGDLADRQTIKNRHHQLEVYPCLALEGDDMYLTVAADPQQSEQQHREAVWTLLQRTLHDKVKYLQKQLPMQKACLIYSPYGTCESLKTQVIERALKQLIPEPQTIRTQQAFEQALQTLRAEWVNHAQKLAKLVNEILTAHQKIAKQVSGRVNPRWLASIGDIKDQLSELICAGFVANTPDPWLAQLPRYLQALEKRLQKIDQDPSKDQVAIRQLQPLLDQYRAVAENSAYAHHPGLLEIRWLIEELRISLFAQPLKTLQPVSIQRLQKQLKSL
ncbi:ATP-dependent RNA helicase HrpA [Thiomicrorhabdus sp. zzn3]|uniref:ATP-dependent RNA helicase HrpA n=1 Tax=Thiomicrorhabdus sp. zzn3 TaxID=3039775 RepID=UPI002436F6E5|nr:ATP-dependent RNA helicase HrpA [Thiomicrorhabdus sp. zzn3]MDG6778164.1 ATP-dependent RNA helicase HrpA [Thiomicrorhabdus sp. zzn3]